MGKITFRADDDLVERVEAFEASKSEVMRQALRAYLEGNASGDRSHGRTPFEPGSFDALLAERIDAAIEERLARQPRDVNVNITVDGEARAADAPERADTRPAASDTDPDPVRDEAHTCGQCGNPVDPDHVHCPNCGEKQSRRVFCDCGDELRSDWSFCPSCGRRTPAADVLDSS